MVTKYVFWATFKQIFLLADILEFWNGMEFFKVEICLEWNFGIGSFWNGTGIEKFSNCRVLAFLRHGTLLMYILHTLQPSPDA